MVSVVYFWVSWVQSTAAVIAQLVTRIFMFSCFAEIIFGTKSCFLCTFDIYIYSIWPTVSSGWGGSRVIGFLYNAELPRGRGSSI
jgi:hypothetical protein